MDRLLSPLTGEGPVTLLYSFDANELIADYMKVFAIDIRKYLNGVDSISVLKCLRTGYRFYYPLNLSGDAQFYSQLEKHPWYYMETKWEYDEAARQVQRGDHVLDIGAGRGSFLQQVMTIPDVKCVGLELNRSAVATARARGVNVVAETAEDHAANHSEEYDVISLFQVLEHIPNPASLLNSVMSMLKPGGRLVIAVPDNSARASSSLFVTTDSLLNMPPHHLALWDVISLASLARLYPVILEELIVEPSTAGHHKNTYRGLVKSNLETKYGILGLACYFAIRPILINLVHQLEGYLPAHTILASYTKYR